MTTVTSSSSAVPVPRRLLLPPHSSDTALHAHLSLGTQPLLGTHRYLGVDIVAQNGAVAKALAREAFQAEEAGDGARAIELLTQAMAWDQAGALDRDWAVRRAVLLDATGNGAPRRAAELYDIGCTLKGLGRWAEAEHSYDSALALDPAFLWPVNNTAWMLATAPAEEAHFGARAILAAEWACARSGFGYWCFLGTLAAAFARNGDFERAVAWQKVSLRLTPDLHRDSAQRELECFGRGQAWIDCEPLLAAGGQLSVEDLNEVDLVALLARAAELRRSSGETLH